MNAQFLFAHAVWFRLAIVGIDILAVIAIVHLWSSVVTWWRAASPRKAESVRVRTGRIGPARP